MRCSVKQAMRMDEEEFEQAFTCAAAINIARPKIIEREAEKASRKRKNG